MTRRYDPRRARPHRNYKREELAAVFGVNIGTISRWRRNGLNPIDEGRPYIFDGRTVRAFLERYNKPRQPTKPGQLFCVACKRPTTPLDNLVDFVPLGSTHGNFIGTCPRCGRRVWQRVRKADILQKAGKLTVRYKDDAATLSGDGEPPRTEPSDGDLL